MNNRYQGIPFDATINQWLLLTSEVRLRPCGAENWPGEVHQLKKLGSWENKKQEIWLSEEGLFIDFTDFIIRIFMDMGHKFNINSGINWDFFKPTIMGVEKIEIRGMNHQTFGFKHQNGVCNDSPTIYISSDGLSVRSNKQWGLTNMRNVPWFSHDLHSSTATSVKWSSQFWRNVIYKYEGFSSRWGWITTAYPGIGWVLNQPMVD